MTAQAKTALRITMLGDWHVGTGAGRPGELDRLVARDIDGLPYIQAKTLIGMWRDGCERIAWGLDNSKPGGWTGWVDEIFGDEPTRRDPGPAEAAPAEAALALRPARLSATLRRGLCALEPYRAKKHDESLAAYEAAKKEQDEKRRRRERLRAGLTFPKPGVRIDAQTSRARDRNLRMEEMARGGLTLVAPFELRTVSRSGAKWTTEQWDAIGALLVAGASEIERLGGKRRRGSGRCKASVGGLMCLDEKLLTHLARAPSPPEITDAPEATAEASPAGAGWRALPIRIELLTPVVAADATVGNVVESLDHVPGSLLLPVVARALAGVSGVDAAAEIAAGNVIVLPATIEIDGQRGLPVPFALHVPKGAPGVSGVRNRFVEQEADRKGEFEPDETGGIKEVKNRQAKRTGYVLSVCAHAPVPYKNVELVVMTHGTIAEEAQRPTEQVGGVFSYEAIPAGTKLRSEIRLRSGLADKLPRDWPQHLGAARLGRSKKDDYGQVEITAADPWRDLPDPDTDRFKSVSEPATGQEQELRLWLLSDLLLRDEGLRLNVDNATLRTALAAALQVKKDRLRLGEPQGQALISADLRVRRYDAWQARWGRPRPSLVGLHAGSCLRIVITPGDLPGNPVTAERLAQIEAEGVGERRAEGFGQVRFEDPLLTQKRARRQGEKSEPTQRTSAGSQPSKQETPTLIRKGTGENQDYEVAQVIERAAWRKAIAEAATALALDKNERKRVFGFVPGKPGPSQLGALRSHIAGIIEPAGPGSAVCKWLEGVKERRADKWPGNSLRLIKEVLIEENAIWEHLKVHEIKVHEMVEPLTEDAKERLQKELWGEAVSAAIGAAIRAQIFAARREDRVLRDPATTLQTGDQAHA